jgi:hypothetical protein
VFIDGLDNGNIKFIKYDIIVVPSDFNFNYLSENDTRTQLDSTLILYNLIRRVDFFTRIWNKSNTATDNIFIHTLHISKFLITPLVNGLSDHNAQLQTINKINVTIQNVTLNF